MPGIAHAAETAEHSGISIHLAPKVIGHLWGIPLTNTLLTVWLVMALLILAAYLIGRNMRLVPSGTQIVFEEVIGYVHAYVGEVLENRELARRIFPLIMTIFLFILAINWIGLLPGVTSIGFYETHNGAKQLVPLLYPGNTDLNITIAFAVIAFFTIEIAGVLLLGFWKYTGKFVNLSFLKKFNTENLLAFFIGIIELFSEIARLVSFSFRLFGNIFAGKTLLLIALFFVPLVIPVPILAFEIFVGFIQAFIFAILTLFFIKLAIEAPH
jgi:F-type H+-transporting ATPase subunit a